MLPIAFARRLGYDFLPSLVTWQLASAAQILSLGQSSTKSWRLAKRYVREPFWCIRFMAQPGGDDPNDL